MSMNTHSILEKDFEDIIIDSLASQGWEYESDAKTQREGWDIDRALYVPDVIAWVKEQSPDTWKKITDVKDPSMEKLVIDDLLNRLAFILDGKVGSGNRVGEGQQGMLLDVFKRGFNYAPKTSLVKRPVRAQIPSMAQYPSDNPNDKAQKRLKDNKLRVLRQVRFDSNSNDTIDLVLTLNGIPVVTIELKTENTQSVQDAITQYKNDRIPNDNRSLLKNGRCLVHFAMSNNEVYMTSHLNGKETVFLPFNQGDGDRSGNPENPHGSNTSYMWEKIFSPHMFLTILKDYVFWERASKGNKGRMIFPRFHQIRSTERVTQDIKENGVGNKYLIQHSAGSGKTKTIAWMAHKASNMLDSNGLKVFDKVIVVTDRNALDANVSEGLAARTDTPFGKVVNIDRSVGAKSPALKEALTGIPAIISCTVQTFPALLKHAEKLPNLAEKKFCVIIDEAHSSQNGETAQALNSTLKNAIISDEDDLDDAIRAANSAMANSTNVTFIALTATPKAQTLAKFGTPDYETGLNKPFDTYSMNQAIEEGFILDVLKSYATYEMYATIRDALNRTQQVDKSKAIHKILEFVKESPETIEVKAKIVVGHFIHNILYAMNGEAKAMVVTSSRKQAYLWNKAINDFLESINKKDEIEAVVAFSGSLDVDGESLTENAINGGIKDVEKYFRGTPKAKILVVADKFQTGFDEPRLLAMYVDKKLTGVAAVQTLSRLNRTRSGKPSPVVLDFVNDSKDILESFKPYYKQASLVDDIDFNLIDDIANRMDHAGFYSESEMIELAEAQMRPDNPRRAFEIIRGKINPIVRRWHKRISEANESRDMDEIGICRRFKADCHAYVRAWEFFSQMIDYDDPIMQKRAVAADLIYRNLREDKKIDDNDYVVGIDLLNVSVAPSSECKDLELSKTDQTDAMEIDTPGSGSVTPPSEVKEAMPTVVSTINEMLAAKGKSVPTSTSEKIISIVMGKLAQNKDFASLIAKNSMEDLFKLKSVKDAFTLAFYEASEEFKDLHSVFLEQIGLQNTELMSVIIADIKKTNE